MRAIPLHFDRLPRYVLLLIAMLSEIVVAPMLVSVWGGLIVARLATGVMLAAALWTVGASRTNVLCFSFAAAGLICAALSRDPAFVFIELALRALFVAYVAGAILWNVLQREQVTFDTIAGSICAYMLLGLVFAPAYLLIEKFHPGSFDIPANWRIGPGNDIAPAMVYFSYITLTTVGFGDIRPIGPLAGGFVVVEAVIGPLYLAITVARLVGLHISRHD
jgi:voltage-gated potassium channel